MVAPQLPRWYRWAGLVLVVVLVGVIAWNAWPRWSTEPLQVVEVVGDRLTVQPTWCNPDDVRTDVEETDASVTLTVSLLDDVGPSQDDCAGPSTTVTLEQPLGDRDLVDGSDGSVLTCEPPGAATRVCER